MISRGLLLLYLLCFPIHFPCLFRLAAIATFVPQLFQTIDFEAFALVFLSVMQIIPVLSYFVSVYISLEVGGIYIHIQDSVYHINSHIAYRLVQM